MSDQLVRKLNELGYQPVFLPKTGVVPPDLYNYVTTQKRLVRLGSLSQYLPAVAQLTAAEGELADISYQYTSTKKQEAAVSFLENALRCIGIDAAPRLNLRFTGSKDFSFAFGNVTYQSTDPSALSQVISGMTTRGIPESYVQGGNLHVAYEYAYARELTMSRGDQRSFAQDITGKVGDYIDLGTKGSVSVASESKISFKASGSVTAAFAYKAARLALESKGWVLYAEEVMMAAPNQQGISPRRPYLPRRSRVLDVIHDVQL
jgi:hypothetical protein